MKVKEYEKLIQQHPSFVLKKDLEPNEIQNIRNNVARDIFEDDIIAFSDVSLFRNAKKGVLITKSAIYQDDKLPFKGVKEIDRIFIDKNHILLSFVYNDNSKKEMKVTITTKQMLFVNVLQQIVERYNKELQQTKVNDKPKAKKENVEKTVLKRISDKIVNIIILGGNGSGKKTVRDALIKELKITQFQEVDSKMANISLIEVYGNECTFQLFCIDEDEEVIEMFTNAIKNVDCAIIVSDIQKIEDDDAIISLREISKANPKFIVYYFNKCDELEKEELEERLDQEKMMVHDYVKDFYDGDFTFDYGSAKNEQSITVFRNILSKIPETRIKKFKNVRQYLQDFVDSNLLNYSYEDVAIVQEYNNDNKFWSSDVLNKLADYKYHMNGEYYYRLALDYLDKKDSTSAQKNLIMASLFHHAPSMYKLGNIEEAASLWYHDAMLTMYENSGGEQKQDWYNRIHTEYEPGYKKVACINNVDKNVCVYCGNCVRACRKNAIHFVDGTIMVDSQNCVGCAECIDDCPYGYIHYYYIRIKKGRPDYTVQINHNTCDQCGLCVTECPIKVFSIVNQQVETFDDLCIGCGYCTDICPYGAITVISKNAVGKENEEILN